VNISDLPAYAVGAFGLLFFIAGLAPPQLFQALSGSTTDDADRALLIILGLCLTSLWATWRWLV